MKYFVKMKAVAMKTEIESIISLRRIKKDLYFGLMKRGFINLTEEEKQILLNLSVDKDIALMLRNGHIFNLKVQNKE